MAFNIGSFAGGLSRGMESGTRLRLEQEREARAKEEAGLRRRVLETQVTDAERRAADDTAVRGAVSMASNPPAEVAGVTPGSEQERMLADQEAGLTRSNPVNQQQQMLKGLDAGWKEALKRGDQANFEKYFGSWIGLRSKLRTEAVNKADVTFKASGGKDLSGYVTAYNEFVDDGTTIKDIRPSPDGQTFESVMVMNGKEVVQKIPRQKVGELLMTLRDPAAMAQHEAKKALALFEASIKPTVIPKGGLAVIGDKEISNPEERPLKDNFVTRTLPGEHGGQEVVDLRTVGQPGGTTGVPPSPQGPTKEDREFYTKHQGVLDDVRTRVDASIGDRVTDPVTGKLNYAPNEKSRAASAWATGIYRWSVKNGNPIGPDVLSEIVTKGQYHDANGKPLMAVYKDSDGKLYKAPTILYQGQTYISDSQPQPLTDAEAQAFTNRGKPKAEAAAQPKPQPQPAAKPQPKSEPKPAPVEAAPPKDGNAGLPRRDTTRRDAEIAAMNKAFGNPRREQVQQQNARDVEQNFESRLKLENGIDDVEWLNANMGRMSNAQKRRAREAVNQFSRSYKASRKEPIVTASE